MKREKGGHIIQPHQEKTKIDTFLVTTLILTTGNYFIKKYIASIYFFINKYRYNKIISS